MYDVSFLDGLYSLTDSYDAFIIDQWGVLHNGEHAYDGVVETLKKLKKDGKQVVVLSNSAKRAEYSADRLKDLGIKPNLYNGVLSSGEVTWQGLKNQDIDPFKNLGDKCFLISKPNDYTILEGLDIDRVDDIEEATFILITGFDGKQETLDGLESVFKKAVAKHVHVICANPDTVTIKGSERGLGPGLVAQKYHDLGGVVHYIGKPHKLVFKSALSMFEGVIPSRVLMIGDSMHHDIAGAMGTDIDAAFITGGVHSKEFKKDMSIEDKDKIIARICKNYGGLHPKYYMDSLVWQSSEAIRREKERAKVSDEN